MTIYAATMPTGLAGSDSLCDRNEFSKPFENESR
jgi:hypothetical protein